MASMRRGVSVGIRNKLLHVDESAHQPVLSNFNIIAERHARKVARISSVTRKNGLIYVTTVVRLKSKEAASTATPKRQNNVPKMAVAPLAKDIVDCDTSIAPSAAESNKPYKSLDGDYYSISGLATLRPKYTWANPESSQNVAVTVTSTSTILQYVEPPSSSSPAPIAPITTNEAVAPVQGSSTLTEQRNLASAIFDGLILFASGVLLVLGVLGFCMVCVFYVALCLAHPLSVIAIIAGVWAASRD